MCLPARANLWVLGSWPGLASAPVKPRAEFSWGFFFFFLFYFPFLVPLPQLCVPFQFQALVRPFLGCPFWGLLGATLTPAQGKAACCLIRGLVDFAASSPSAKPLKSRTSP